MISQEEGWNKTFRSFKNFSDKTGKYDNWLDKYSEILSQSEEIPIVDLGCGFGGNTLYLIERGYDVISCDFSDEALKGLKKNIPDARIMKFNMLSGLPFKDESKRIIIADLSIHYFLWSDTKEVVNDIQRVLMNDGVIFCRVNSINDSNYGAGKGTVIEKNYFNINGRFKRFFSEESLKELFQDWELLCLKEDTTKRYGHEKILWEVVVRKRDKSL